MALQEAAEAYLVSLFEDTNLVAIRKNNEVCGCALTNFPGHLYRPLSVPSVSEILFTYVIIHLVRCLDS